MSGPIRQPLADVTTVTPTLSDKAVTIQANTVRTSSYTTIYNLFKTGFDAVYATIASVNGKLSLTGGTMSGAIAMGTSKITGLGTPTANQDATTKLYVDTAASTAEANAISNAKDYTDNELLTKQNVFDYGGSAIGVTPLTIDDFKGGVAEFTNVIARNTSSTLRLISDQITATSKIIYSLNYSGAGFPQILSHSTSLNSVDFKIANTDPTLGSGTATNASLFIEYQIVG
jgi:hypothetical protein